MNAIVPIKKRPGRPKGLPKTGGRAKGTPNRVTGDVRKAILEAFEMAGGAQYLARVAEEKPETFCVLLGKALPLSFSGGEEGTSGKITIRWEK